MGSLTDDMTRLRDEIGASRQSRFGFLGQLQNDTVELQTFSSGLSVDVTRMLEGFLNHRSETAEKTEAGLRAFMNGLKRDVSDMQTGFRTDHAEMTRRMKGNLGDFVSALKEHAEQMESSFGRDRLDMAREGRIGREVFLSEVRKTVSDLGHRVADLRATFATDIENAHRAWAGTSAPGKKDAGPVEKARKGTSDDLTQISGIGPGRQSRLNAVGLFTLEQLAASTPTVLKAALGKMDAAAEVEKWIEQAKALV